MGASAPGGARPRGLDLGRLGTELRAEVGEAERLGLLDPALLDAFEAELVELIEAGVAAEIAPVCEAMGVDLAELVFGDCDYANRLDRQLATCASAVSHVVVEETVEASTLLAVAAVCRSVRTLTPARLGKPAGA